MCLTETVRLLTGKVRARGGASFASFPNAGKDAVEWTVEIALPWAVRMEAVPEQPPPRGGEQWRVNFARPGWSLRVVDGAYQKEESEDAEGAPVQVRHDGKGGTTSAHEREDLGTGLAVQEGRGDVRVRFI